VAWPGRLAAPDEQDLGPQQVLSYTLKRGSVTDKLFCLEKLDLEVPQPK
jgi:hypothetical protein